MKRLVAIAVALALVVPAAASAACPRTSVTAIENQVMCQVCGVPLALANESPEAARERAFIERLVARCETPAQIKAALVAQYGPSVLALPPGHGFDLAAYLVPVLALIGAAALVAMVALAWRRRVRPTRRLAEAPSLDPADAARVDAALDAFEG